MLTQNFMNLIIMRFRVSKYFSSCTYMQWNSNQQQFVPCKGALYWNCLILLYICPIYVLAFGGHLLNKSLANEYGELSGAQLASYVLGWTEFVMLICIEILALHTASHRYDAIYLCNQMWAYTKETEGLFVKFISFKKFKNFISVFLFYRKNQAE